ncbi:MAG TPA: efflux RND transporter periplasmic adaptor subunit [Micropepsaceae bacterium]|jgi:multidrug efflux system membrane fusion protein|nr:efflux RND transporter periplasmic adaptor subunit [Micropepsaceae bacterium]
MSRFSTSFKKRAVLLGTAAIFAIWGGAFAFLELSHATEQPAPVTEVPAVPVNVETVKPGDVRVWSEFSGRLNAVDYAEIRPEVSGRITDVRFQDGQTVKAGDVLFVIDPRPFEAALAKAEANLASARTNAAFAQTEFDRAATLIKSQAIAQRLYDQQANAKRVADAAVQAAEAELLQAKVDIDHAYVKAPIGGRISRPEITLGNLVEAGPNAPLLTSVVSNDGIYADFEVDEQTYVQFVRTQADTEAKERRIPVQMTVQGDNERLYKGTIYSFDNRINTASGTIRARARFDNKDGSLVPGMFVAVKIGSEMKSVALVVPERAIGNDQNKKFIFVVGNDNKVAYREVALGQQVEGKRIILSGLHAGERVVVDGLQHIAPDATVQAIEKPDPGSTTTP